MDTTTNSRRFRRLALTTGLALGLLVPGQAAFAGDLPVGPLVPGPGPDGPGDITIPELEPECPILDCDDPVLIPDPDTDDPGDPGDPDEPVDEPDEPVDEPDQPVDEPDEPVDEPEDPDQPAEETDEPTDVPEADGSVDEAVPAQPTFTG